MAKGKKVRGARYLLNLPGYHSTAAIIAEIEDTRGWKDGQDGEDVEITSSWRLKPSTTLEITDCDEKVTFEIDWDTKADRKASLTKINRMVNAMTAFRDALVEEQALYEKRQKAAGL